jgi:chemotaxis protein CheD
MKETEVKMGEIAVADCPGALVVTGVGSCVVVTLYDAKRKMGALAHTMLGPSQNGEAETDRTSPVKHPGCYVDRAIDEMCKRLIALGAMHQGLEAKLVGGANMFPLLKSDIGAKNVASAKKVLENKGIRLVGEAVGGSIGRSVHFSIHSGIISVKTRF